MLQSVVFTITDRQLGYIIYIFYYVLELILYSILTHLAYIANGKKRVLFYTLQ